MARPARSGEPRGAGRVKLSLLDLPLRPDQLLELVPERLRERVVGPDGVGPDDAAQ